ncbi:vitamin B6 photo-protection and homoeostasis-domain-containing protein [Polychytrium aggregatum]|uniref:vitamin B6 photo-protection and homoeostasis-domain-containing protein n=1 Tax=Polychytrium aggregatum TaxID=110093 RepID=UPI0022FE3E1D|nr:vitamin B6 photo-protection and homoeostasis-domain-containing protein [Polychytrium aggregatum]KAI9209705.1 vitamin B6 photo-protection and homoeostasis-domain-containing protein [Polychytrium aggregatum]
MESHHGDNRHVLAESGVWVVNAGTTSSPLASLQKSLWRFSAVTFLPANYPRSVSEDYAPYQICNILQNFCSKITGLLGTQSTFKTFGVGDATATAAAATITTVLQDGSGMLGQILFTYGFGSHMDEHIKVWRYSADVFFDAAIFLDILAPNLPRKYFVFTACCASVLRAICGVTAGSTKSSIYQHFALEENLGDIHAKEQSQSTLINLIAMIFGTLIIRMAHEDAAWIWGLFIFFSVLHLVFNYIGVRSVVFSNLTADRMQIVIKSYLSSKGAEMMTPSQVAPLESILTLPSIPVEMGISLEHLATQARLQAPNESSDAKLLAELAAAWEGKKYMAARTPSGVAVALHDGCEVKDCIEAFFCGLAWVQLELPDAVAARQYIQSHFEPFYQSLATKWDVDRKLYFNDNGWRSRWKLTKKD